MARAFAGRAAQTLEFAQAEGDRHRLSVLEDRNRIARDLHDVVIQRLYGLGLRMERVLGQLPEQIAAQLADINTDLDETIDEIRNTVFSLRVTSEARTGLRADVVRMVEQSAELLGFVPRLNIFGALDSDVSEPVAAHALATLSEALSNVVRHAAATEVDVLIRTTSSELTLRVADNGCGVPSHPHESGLSNLRRRAAELGGTMRVDSVQVDSGVDLNADERPGTVLTWTVPLAGIAARPRFRHATAEPAQRAASLG
jgi:signal transduction histidine kinase